jgi:hypothetical protein
MTKKLKQAVSSVVCFAKHKTMMRLLSLFLLIGMTQLTAVSAGVASSDDFQQINVSGKVVDNQGNPLIGVNIIEKGTTNGKISGGDGSYAISVTSGKSVLTFSFIGYTTVDVPVGTQTAINVTLLETQTALDEIVVVGYSTQTRKSLTGAVSTVNQAALAESAAGKSSRGYSS